MAAFLIIVSVIGMAHGQWSVIDDPSLPRGDSEMAIGYYNESIYLLYVLFVSVHCQIEIDVEC